MRHETGGYSASIDADAGGEEGSFHVWRKDEINKLLPESSASDYLQELRPGSGPEFRRQGVAPGQAAVSGGACKGLPVILNRPLNRRWKRPGRCWYRPVKNGFTRHWMANGSHRGMLYWRKAWFAPGWPWTGKTGWIQLIRSFSSFIREAWDGERLFAVYNAGEAKFAAYLDDYAWLLNAIMLFLQARWKDEYLHFATQIGDALLARFQDKEHGGFFFSDAVVEVPIARSMIFQDDATPAGNAIAVSALQKLGALTGKLHYTRGCAIVPGSQHGSARAKPPGLRQPAAGAAGVSESTAPHHYFGNRRPAMRRTETMGKHWLSGRLLPDWPGERLLARYSVRIPLQ